ncbi:Protein CBG25803 [Caenorhabditis briggsae]|uniref:Protein CBG25803 n=1 Tax=Caenorhabditis briggsae TaxID=6238 RepID=B6IJU6_CAEBR|nr:Protein CBG25803 [Caenorhabditis briggsae]CAS00176.1 Protein CBG25803 [Caenorhabditis briggsae]
MMPSIPECFENKNNRRYYEIAKIMIVKELLNIHPTEKHIKSIGVSKSLFDSIKRAFATQKEEEVEVAVQKKEKPRGTEKIRTQWIAPKAPKAINNDNFSKKFVVQQPKRHN